MGGKGSGYRIPLTLTREMRIALTKFAAQEESPTDFHLALRAMRVGLIVYGVLSEDDLRSMYHRKLINNDEAQFLIEKGLVKKDFRPISIEKIHQANELRMLNNQFRNVIESWEGLKECARIYWLKQARKYPDIHNAMKLLAIAKVAKDFVMEEK